ncbi:MAG TPA: hypothetical protein PK177_06780 [Burkholderiaceae bacterium]|nr:hypothetical protein [Burkholderiaceae bacterium]
MDSASVSARRTLMRGTLAALALPLLAACESSPFSRRGDRRRTPSDRETEREREIERRKGENSSRADPPAAPAPAPQA